MNLPNAKKYRKKPITVEAFRIGIDPIPEWAQDANHFKIVHSDNGLVVGEIHTLEGIMKGYYGDYVIRGAIGELYPCRADIFEDTYTSTQIEDTNIHQKVLQRLYGLMATGQTEKVNQVLARIYTWGQLKSSPEMSIEEIAYSSDLVLRNLLRESELDSNSNAK